MKQLKALYYKIINIGVRPDMLFDEKKQLVKLNKVYLLAIPASILACVPSLDSFWFVFISLSIGVAIQFCLLFHYWGWYRFANIYLNLVFNILCSILAVGFHGTLGSEYYLFVDILIIQLQFKWNKPYSRIVLSVIVCFLFISIKFINHFDHIHFPIPKYAFYILMQNIVVVFFFIMYLMHEYAVLIQNYQSEIETQNETLAQKTRDLIDSNQIKDQLFSIIGHDLNKPLASLKGFISLMSEDLLTKEEQKKCLIQLESLLESTDFTLKNLLEWGMQNKKESSSDKLSVMFYAEQNIRLLQGNATQKNIQIINDVTRNACVFADRHQFSFILRNLLANAIKFTHQNGKIRIFTEEKKNEWQIFVEDNGVGIKAAHLPKLFRMDNRFSTLGTAKESGTGLGLPLCNEFVEVNRGKMSVESEEGKGSIFSFTIPKCVDNQHYMGSEENISQG